MKGVERLFNLVDAFIEDPSPANRNTPAEKMIRTANLTLSISRNAGGLFESVRRLVQFLSLTGMEDQVYGMADEVTEADITAWEAVTVETSRTHWPEPFGFVPAIV